MTRNPNVRPTHLVTSLSLSVRDRLLNAIIHDKQSDDLNTLVYELLNSKRHTYDPDESLLGPFFCSIVLPNQPQPLWKRLSLNQDIAGQQYFYDGEVFRVVNYSELFGSGVVHLRAEGTFVTAAIETNKTENSRGPLSWFNFGNVPSLRFCPDDYVVTVTQVSLHVGSFVCKLPIEGTSVLRVLYADSDLRIFVSPQDTQSTAGDWEQEGLVVVQVRNDLVNPFRPIDLRTS